MNELNREITPRSDGKKTSRTAILIIHGIGQQPRYETLLAFGRGLHRYLDSRGSQPVVEMVPMKELPRGMNRGLRFRTLRENEDALVDVYEYYWGPFTQGKLSILATLKWCIARTFPRPEQLTAFPHPKGIWDGFVLGVYLFTILGMLVLAVGSALVALLPVGINLSPVSLFTLSFSTIVMALEELGETNPWTWLWVLVLAFGLWHVMFRLTALLTIVFGSGTYSLPIDDETGARISRDNDWLNMKPRRILGNLLWLFMALIVYQVANLQIAESIPIPSRLAFAVITLVAFREFLASYLKNFIGDIPVYLSRNEYSEAYSVRRKILDTGSDLLLALLALDGTQIPPVTVKLRAPEASDNQSETRFRPIYERVIVAGHSLGSVIGLDILRQTYLRVLATGNGQEIWEKITDFITFGSPLRKVSYFILQEEGNPERLRMDSYVSTLKLVFRSGTKNEMKWHNFVIRSDPIADYLGRSTAYAGIARDYTLPGIGEPLTSHSRYWKDPHFYEWVGTLTGL